MSFFYLNIISHSINNDNNQGESIAIVLALVGAKPTKEGTGRVVRFDLIPLQELNRPRIDVLASLSGIFRDSFANVVDLLDDMFERCAEADEPIEMNFIKKHTLDLAKDGVERPAARLFSNPPGDYGSMVNEVVGSGDWDDSDSLGETWKGRNVFSYGRNEGSGKGKSGTARPDVLEKLLTTTERIVQEIDSVEYGLTDIQGRLMKQHVYVLCTLSMISFPTGFNILPRILCKYRCIEEGG